MVDPLQAGGVGLDQIQTLVLPMVDDPIAPTPEQRAQHTYFGQNESDALPEETNLTQAEETDPTLEASSSRSAVVKNLPMELRYKMIHARLEPSCM